VTVELVITTDFPDTPGVFVLILVGLVSVGFLLGLSIGRPWALFLLPLLLPVVVVLTKTMQVTASVPPLLVYGTASLGGTWLGMALRRGVRRPSSS
jgi:hypothetical protein